MSRRRRDADRAEAIVKGIAALVLLFALLMTARLLPAFLKGKRSTASQKLLVASVNNAQPKKYSG